MFPIKLKFPFTPEEVHRAFIDLARALGLSPQQALLLGCRALDDLLSRERYNDRDARRWVREQVRHIREAYPASPDWDYDAYQQSRHRKERRQQSTRNWKAPYRFVHKNEIKPLPSRWYAWYKKELLGPPLNLAPHQAFVLLVRAIPEFNRDQLETWQREITRDYPDTWDWAIYPLSGERI